MAYYRIPYTTVTNNNGTHSGINITDNIISGNNVTFSAIINICTKAINLKSKRIVASLILSTPVQIIKLTDLILLNRKTLPYSHHHVIDKLYHT